MNSTRPENVAGVSNWQAQSTRLAQPNLKLNALSNWIALCVNIGIGLILTPALLNHLGKTHYGVWVLVASLVGYFGLLKLGTGTAVLRYVPLYRGQGDYAKVSAAVSSAFSLFTVLGLIMFVLAMLLAEPLTRFYGQGPTFTAFVRLAGIAAAVRCPAEVLDAAVRGYERFVYVNIVTISQALLRAALLFWCIWAGYGLPAMGLSLVIVGAASLLIYAVIFHRCCEGARLQIGRAQWKELKKLTGFGLVIVLAGTANLVTFEAPKLIVGKILSLEAVAVFGIAGQLMAYYRQSIYSLTRVFMPRFSFLSGQRGGGAPRLYLRGTQAVTAVAAFIGLMLWTVGPAFMRLWLPIDFSEGIPVLMVLTAGMLVLLTNRLGIELLFGMGRQKYLAAIEVLEAALVLALVLVLGVKVGMLGAAVGSVAPLLLTRGFIQARKICQLLDVSMGSYYVQCVLRPWAGAVAVGLIFYLFGGYGRIDGWLSLFAAAALVAGGYGLVGYFLLIQRTTRQRISQSILASTRGLRLYTARQRD